MYAELTGIDYVITWIGLVAGLIAVNVVNGLDRRLGRVRRWFSFLTVGVLLLLAAVRAVFAVVGLVSDRKSVV